MTKLKGELRNGLTNFIPDDSLHYVVDLFDGSFKLKIKNPRKTKLGDFRPSMDKGKCHQISVNNDLNEYAFLVTLIHEIAHAHAWDKYRKKIKPHGTEWKTIFQHLMLPLLNTAVFPDDVLRALSSYLTNPAASSCADMNLSVALKKYDNNVSTILHLKDIPIHTTFKSGNRTFKKGKKARKRYYCKEIGTELEYRIHPLAEVKIIKKDPTR